MPSVVNRDRDVWLCENDLSPKLLHLTSTGKFMIVQSSRLVRMYKKWNKGEKKKRRRERKSFAITFLDVFILKVKSNALARLRICIRDWRFCYTKGCVIEIVHPVEVIYSTEKFQIWDKWTWDSRNTSFWIKNTIKISRKWCAGFKIVKVTKLSNRWSSLEIGEKEFLKIFEELAIF